MCINWLCFAVLIICTEINNIKVLYYYYYYYYYYLLYAGHSRLYIRNKPCF
jgi:hypothetical protein